MTYYKSLHSGKSFDKDLTHLTAGEVSCHQDKRSHTSLHQNGAFMRAIPNPSIPGEHHLAPTSDLLQPFLVFGIAAEMVIMHLHIYA